MTKKYEVGMTKKYEVGRMTGKVNIKKLTVIDENSSKPDKATDSLAFRLFQHARERD